MDDRGLTTAELTALFDAGLRETVRALDEVTGLDWSRPAGTLEWSCWGTVDHVTDCLFSYVLQLAGEVRGGFLKLEELHAVPDAPASQLVASLHAVGRTFAAVLATAPPDAIASDGMFELTPPDWTARALNELLLHTHDVRTGLGHPYRPPPEVAAFVLRSPGLWMYDGVERDVPDAWSTMLVGSGRAPA